MNTNYRKGIPYAMGALFLVSLQPIVANSRPAVLDPYIFAAMTCLIQVIIIAPMVIIEEKRFRARILLNTPSLQKREELITKRKEGLKKNKGFLLYIGINFAAAQVLFFIAYQYAGAINGSLAQQTSIIFGILFGFLINHEKVSYKQMLFSGILFFGLFLAVTQGKFSLIEFNIGVLIMVFVTAMWMMAHAQSKKVFNRGDVTPIQLVFIRNIIGSILLLSTYFIFYPLENVVLFFDPLNILFFIMIGLLYGFDVVCWYKTIDYIEVSKATVLVSPMLVLTAIFAFIFLGELFTIFHLIGTVIIIASIIMIVREKPKRIEKEIRK